MRFFTYSQNGRREKNEDTYDTLTTGGNQYAAVYDGHGGNFVSKYLKNHFLPELAKISGVPSEVQNIVDDMQQDFHKTSYEKTKQCGSTLLACHVHKEEGFIRTINIGDCRALLSRNDGSIVQLSEDHKPSPEVKKEAIRFRRTKCGGARFDREDRVWRTADGFSVSRALGDLQSPCLSQRVDVSTVRFPEDARFVILGCDGIWDVLNNKQACEVASDAFSNGKNPAKAVCQLAYDKHSMDNLTAVVIAFPARKNDSA